MYFPGCGSERLHADVAKAVLFLLLRTGTRVILPPPFLCCGFPLQANARRGEHRNVVLANTILFSQMRDMFHSLSFDACVVSCGTCLEALHTTGVEDIFGAPLKDATAFALQHGLDASLTGRYGYHRPCHDSLGGNVREIVAGGEGFALVELPHCCSEAGTLALSRPDISQAMLKRKSEALRMVPGKIPAVILTNCPSCLSGLGRLADGSWMPRHLAVEYARVAGGEGWETELRRLASTGEAVNC
jgi:D-lactate dehydrogenase (cytochrome)